MVGYMELIKLLNSYGIDYLKSVDKNNFDKIYQLLKSYNFNYIEDIILGYLEIFELNYDVVEKKINNLKKILGKDYVNIIGNDMSYLEYIARN